MTSDFGKALARRERRLFEGRWSWLTSSLYGSRSPMSQYWVVLMSGI